MSDYTCDLSGTESFVKKDGHKMFTTDIVNDLNYWKQKAEKLQAENAELKKQSQWISVEDELPEINQRVLTFRPDILSVYDVDRFRFCRFGRKGFDSVYKVTHWMPLPTPPEGG